MSNIINLHNVSDVNLWLENDNNIYVGRPNQYDPEAKWGNPHKLDELNDELNDRQRVVKLYKQYILENKELLSNVHILKGKILGCWCSPSLCHAQILHELAGNYPVYQDLNPQSHKTNSQDVTADKMTHDHNTRRSNPSEKPPLSPKPTGHKQPKLNSTQLQEKVEQLEQQLLQLITDSKEKDVRLKKMEDRIYQLEADEIKNASYLAVQRNVSTLLANRVAQLEQYSRRHSVIVSGIERKVGENNDSLRAEVNSLLQEAGSTAKIEDVDKLHRNGPRQGGRQDLIVKFKTHSAKEAFYKSRKSITSREVWVKPSLSSHNTSLLKEAKDFIKPFIGNTRTYENPPEFVFANVHGDLQVKMAKETDGSMFHSFNSMQKLFEIINKSDNQSAFLVFDEDNSRFEDARSVFPRSPTEIAALDASMAEDRAKAVAEAGKLAVAVSAVEVVTTGTPNPSST